MKPDHDNLPIVYVIDDDRSLRDSLRLLFQSAGFEAQCYEDAKSFLADLDVSRPGCVLIDVRLPGSMDGFSLQAELHARRCTKPVVFITGYGDVRTAVRAMKGSAFDFLEKPCAEKELLGAVQRALATDRERRRRDQDVELFRQYSTRLTPREREVLERVFRGQANKVMASEMKLSVKTIEAHRASMMRKLDADSLAQLVRLKTLSELGLPALMTGGPPAGVTTAGVIA